MSGPTTKTDADMSRSIRERERRLERKFERVAREAEADMYREVKAHMDAGLTFDEAWVKSGGIIVDAR
jgi:hypothetical protein